MESTTLSYSQKLEEHTPNIKRIKIEQNYRKKDLDGFFAQPADCQKYKTKKWLTIQHIKMNN